MLVVRQDQVEMTGRVVSVLPPMPDLITSLPSNTWTLVVKPDQSHTHLLRRRNGASNPVDTIACLVNVDPTLISWGDLGRLLAPAVGQSVRLIGTLCDDDSTLSTVICPLGLLAVEYPFTTYDINGWPVIVSDISLFAFAHAPSTTEPFTDPHTGENRVFSLSVPFPPRPTGAAVPFWRAYPSTRVDHAASVAFMHVDLVDSDVLDIRVDTGTPASGERFFAVQIGLTYDEPDLDNHCPPGHCDDSDFCAHTGDFRYMRVPPHIPRAMKGDLVLSPGNGNGTIGLIVGSLDPKQGYDHLGIVVDNGQTIRHCTSSQDRYEDERLHTVDLSVFLPGVPYLTGREIPLNGIRPDLLRYGWPGTITQTVEEVYQTGRNTLNPRWSYETTHSGQDQEDPENPGKPFMLYQLPQADRLRRLQFNDPEIDRGESMKRLQDTPELIGPPRLIKPHPAFDATVRPALHAVADTAMKIDAHYRFFAYTKGDIGLDAAFWAPPMQHPAWRSLPAGAGWAADTMPAMCSSFIWTAVQRVNQTRPVTMPRIILEDRADLPNPATGLDYGVQDGFYQYYRDERTKAARNLVKMLKKKIVKTFNDELPDIAFAFPSPLADLRTRTAKHVSNQTTNAFAFDACEKLDESWQTPGEGETVSPDDILNFWDPKPHTNGQLAQPEGGQSLYGHSEPLFIKQAEWDHVPLFRKQLTDPGKGTVFFTVYLNGNPVEGATVRFDFGCVAVTSTRNLEPRDHIVLSAGTHFAEAYLLVSNPMTGSWETYQTVRPLKFAVDRNGTSQIELKLEPPSDLWRIIDVQLDADIHDRSIWGIWGRDAAHVDFHSKNWQFSLQQDLAGDARNTVLTFENTWKSREVGSGVYVILSISAELKPADRSVNCHCVVALIDADAGTFLDFGAHYTVDQQEIRDVVIPADGSVNVLTNVGFASDELVPERARVSLRLTNRRRPI